MTTGVIVYNNKGGLLVNDEAPMIYRVFPAFADFSGITFTEFKTPAGAFSFPDGSQRYLPSVYMSAGHISGYLSFVVKLPRTDVVATPMVGFTGAWLPTTSSSTHPYGIYNIKIFGGIPGLATFVYVHPCYAKYDSGSTWSPSRTEIYETFFKTSHTGWNALYYDNIVTRPQNTNIDTFSKIDSMHTAGAMYGLWIEGVVKDRDEGNYTYWKVSIGGVPPYYNQNAWKDFLTSGVVFGIPASSLFIDYTQATGMETFSASGKLLMSSRLKAPYGSPISWTDMIKPTASYSSDSTVMTNASTTKINDTVVGTWDFVFPVINSMVVAAAGTQEGIAWDSYASTWLGGSVVKRYDGCRVDTYHFGVSQNSSGNLMMTTVPVAYNPQSWLGKRTDTGSPLVSFVATAGGYFLGGPAGAALGASIGGAYEAANFSMKTYFTSVNTVVENKNDVILIAR